MTKHRWLRLDGTAELDPGLNLLIGRNGTGKTTLLQLLRELSQGSPNSELNVLPPEAADVVNRLTIVRPEASTSVEALRTTNQWSGWEALRDRVRFVTSDRRLSAASKVKSLFPTVDQYEMSEPTQDLNIAEEFTKAIVAELIAKLEDLGQGLQKVTTELEEDYRRALVEFGKDIQLDFERESFVYFLDHHEEEVPIQALSSGEKEYLYFYSYLRRIRNDENKILLIDEPELHLHSTQVAQICRMLARLAERNQVIAATHSAEVLQHFLPQGRIILLDQGALRNIDVPTDIRRVIDRLGIPIDPSVFTAEWIVAENRSGRRLAGDGAPDTEQVLTWLLGTGTTRRYWAFGSSRAWVEGADEILTMATGDQGDADFRILFDGDRNCVSAHTYPPIDPETPDQGRLHYLPFWELENLFLNTNLLEALEVPTEESATDRLWRLVETNQEALLTSIHKTITKNAIRSLKPDRTIDKDGPADGLAAYKEAVDDLGIDREAISQRFTEVIASRNWQWLPGKEALGFLVGDLPTFWELVGALDKGELRELLRTALGSSPIAELSLSSRSTLL